jgi:hypothetical protein
MGIQYPVTPFLFMERCDKRDKNIAKSTLQVQSWV